MVDAKLTFPAGFLWGTATSSHQVEGGNVANDWYRWEQVPDRISDGSRSGLACDWWGGRYSEDFERAAETHQNAHRLSLEWSRIEKGPDDWQAEALDRYRQMIGSARDRGLQPMVTLHHFTNPDWFAQAGGWLNEDSPSRYERYVRRVVQALGDLTAFWVTINEPAVYVYAAYLAGDFPPGSDSPADALQVMTHLVEAHARAYRTIHDLQPNALVGLAHHYRGMKPARPSNPLDRWLTAIRSRAFNDTVPVACRDGVIQLPWGRRRLEAAIDTQDYFGLNYYTRERFALGLASPRQLLGRGFYPGGADVSPEGFIANDPEGFREALQWARGFGLPIYVTENGVEDEEDEFRRRYLAGHLKELWRAATLNGRVKGYFHWSLVDNFEWDRGWSQRFGLWELDRETQERRARPSVDFYAEVCRQNALTTEMVAQHAPAVVEHLFPQDPPGELN